MPDPLKPGDEIYIQSMWSIDHGEDDMDGGLAIIEKFSNWGDSVFVHCVGLDRNLNVAFIMENQEKWKKEYGDRIAHMCPEGESCPNPIRAPKDRRSTACLLCKGRGYIVGGTVGSCHSCLSRTPESARRKKILETAAKEK